MLWLRLVVPDVAQNLTSHKPFVNMGHMSGILLDCKNLSSQAIKAEDAVIPFDKKENGLEHLPEYLPVTEFTQAMVALRLASLPHAELIHLRLMHLCPTLMRHLKDVSVDIGDLRGLSNFTCHCCVEAKLKHAPKPERSLTNDIHLVSFDFCGPFKHTSFSGNKYGLIFVAHHGHVLFWYPTKSKDEFPKFLQQFLVDYLHLFKTFPHMLVLRTI